MDFIFPLTHAVAESLGKTVDKFNFRKNHIAARHLIILVFIGMSLSLGLYLLLTGAALPAFTTTSLSLMIAIGLVSFAANVFDFKSLKVNDLSLREPMLGFKPILAGLLGYILFPEERKVEFLLGFALGAIIVYLGTHRRKLNLRQRRGMSYLLLGVLFYALLPTLYKQTLEYISPEYIAFFRTTAVLLLALILLPRLKWTKLKSKALYGLLSGIVYAVGTVAGLYAIQRLGVVITMLLLLLEPTLKYLSGYIIFKERVRKGEVISSVLLVIIVLAVVAG